MNKEEIIQNVKDCGRYLLENAEAIISDTYYGDLKIICNVAKKGAVRSITIINDVVPPFYFND